MSCHIVLVTTSYPDGAPGSEAAGGFVEDFARELATRVRVTIVTAGSFNEHTTTGNLTVVRFVAPRLPLSLLNPARPGDWGAILLTLRRGRQALEALVADDKPDHIFALWALPSGHWAHTVAKKHGIPFSIWALGSDIWNLGKVPIVRSRLRTVLRNAHRRYADGYQLGEDVEKICGKECLFLPSTRHIEPASAKAPADAPPYKLAFLGRWHSNKGVDLLLDALSLLSPADWDRISEVRLFGGGPLDSTVRQRVSALQTAGRSITLGGYLNKPEARDLISWADYLLIPSRIESIPVIFSDAVKLRTPVVSTPVGDLPRLLNTFGVGTLASGVSASAYADAIRTSLNRPSSEFQSGLALAGQSFDLRQISDDFLRRSLGDLAVAQRQLCT